jgi:hypothetical protein
LSAVFSSFATFLDRRLRSTLAALLIGILFASGRRTVTAWFRAGHLTTQFRSGYTAVWNCGRKTPYLASCVLSALKPLLPDDRLLFAIDDTPTQRYGPRVEGAGIHHNPTPGPAGEKFLYGHVFVTLAALARHPHWHTIALPLQSRLYVRDKDLPKIPAARRPDFRTKLQLAAEQLVWLRQRLGPFRVVSVVADGGYAKRPFLKAAREQHIVVYSRLRKDARLQSVPSGARAAGQRGPLPTYGKQRIALAKRAGQKRGWRKVTCRQYGKQVTKEIKTFLATWRPAGGLIRVVLVREEDGWLAFFCTNPNVTAEQILEALADRGALEQTNKDVKEVWGAGQQQVRNVLANEGCFNLNGWLYSLTEVWAWERCAEELVDRQACPWDDPARRPSHADKRKALQRHMVQAEIQAALAEDPEPGRVLELLERLLFGTP